MDMNMEMARQHWKILHKMERDFTDKVKEFMVIGEEGEGVIMATEPNGEGFWFGKMEFGEESREATKPTRLDVPNLIKMAQGINHIVLLDKLGNIHTLGMNYWGQLGQGTVNDSIDFTPQLIASPHRFIEVRCGPWHSLALTEDGKVWAWGENDYCQVGLSNSNYRVPCLHQISELDSHRVVAIECGGLHSLALTDQGQVYGWGYNFWGQLAHANLLCKSTPVLLSSVDPIIQIAAGYCHTLLLTEGGLVFACGQNRCCQLGQPSTLWSSPTPLQVPGLPPISQIAAHFGASLSIALSTDRRCFIWGEWNRAEFLIPLKLPEIFSTIESPLSFESPLKYTPHSVPIEVTQSDQSPMATDSDT